MGIPIERIVTYPNCIDPTIFNPARFSAEETLALRRKLGIAPDATVATFIGTFGTWHGVDFLASAIKDLIDSDPSWVARNKLHFLIVGDGLKMPDVRTILDDPAYRAARLPTRSGAADECARISGRIRHISIAAFA